jgi:hypothetical protein
MTRKPIVGTWLSLVERTLGVGEVASSNLVVPTTYFQSVTGGESRKWVHGFEPGFVDLGCADSLVWSRQFLPVGFTIDESDDCVRIAVVANQR